MKAIDLIKSLSKSQDVAEKGFRVVTAWHKQTKDRFVLDNFGSSAHTYDNPIPHILDSQDYLCISPDIKLSTPDGKSILEPDIEIHEIKQPGSIIGNCIAQLFKIN